MFRFLLVSMLSLAWLTGGAAAQSQDVPEPGSAEAIKAATTDPHFVSPWVSYIPQSSSVPSPEKFLGRIMGAPGELVGTEKAYAYARALAAASPRVRVFTIGRSEEGRDIIMLAVADEAGIRDLERLKAATAALADPRRTDQGTADKLIADSRPIYYFNAALHSDETGSTEAMLELAYRLAVSEQAMIQRIRERVVVLINPISNPDGRDKMVDWFYRYLKGKTDRNTLPRQSPPYWSKYTFVDINRDTHQQTHETTKAVHRMFHEWHPTVVHDLHEGSPLMMTWNGTGPYNPNIDPITYSEFLALSFHEVEAMTAMGMPGVSTWNFGEAFAHLYLDSVAMNHNSIGRGYETFGNGSAETEKRSISASAASMEWYRLLPAPREVTWSARDNLNYQETGALAALDQTASESQEMLHNFYRKSWDSWQKGLTQPPYAFLIPEDQGDPARVAAMVGRLMGQHIEVAQAQSAIQLKEGSFPAGTYVVRLDQPYRNYAVDLLTPQHYPKDGEAPYDDVSWELPAHYHLQAIATADASIRIAPLTPLTDAPHPKGNVSGSGSMYLLKDTGQESFLAARYRLANFDIHIAEQEFEVGGTKFPAGSWILKTQPGLPEAIASTAAELGLEFIQVSALPDVPRHVARAPRIGLWVPWADTDSIGWIRYSLDQRRVPYTYLRDEDIRAGNLGARIDVLLYGHVDLELAEQIEGLPKTWSPMPFKKTAQTPSFGTPAESDDITGGIGYEGLAQIERFIDRRRPDGDAGQRKHAGPRRRAGAFCAEIVRWRTAQCGRRRWCVIRGRAASWHTDPGRPCESHIRSPGSPHRIRISPPHLRLPAEFPALQRPAPLDAHGVLHDVSRRSGRSQWRGDGVGRYGWETVCRERAGLGRGESDRTTRHPRHAGWQRACGDFQLQSDVSRSEPRRSATAVEYAPQLAGDRRQTTETVGIDGSRA